MAPYSLLRYFKERNLVKYLIVLVMLSSSAFAANSAAELAQNCDSLDAMGADVYSVDRNSKMGFCLGYLNAVMDSFDE